MLTGCWVHARAKRLASSSLPSSHLRPFSPALLPAGDAPACCRKDNAQEESKPAPAATMISATDANSQAFIRKNEQAAAAAMV